MQVFLTGGSGLIGTATIAALTADGHEVRALAQSEASAARVCAGGATPVAGALTDLAALTTAAATADAVIHLAASRTGNVAAIDKAAATALQAGAGPKPYIHTGGVWVYGNTGGIVTETAPIDPPALVSWRQENEAAVLARVKDGGHPVIVMPGVVFADHAGLLETFFVAPARRTGAVAYIGDGTNHCTLVHVEDIAQLYVRALTAPAGSVYAGTNGEYLTFAQIATALSHGAGLNGATTSIDLETARQTMGPLAEAFALDQQIASDKARDELGWQPRIVDAFGYLASPA